jgi:hypothetical protein
MATLIAVAATDILMMKREKECCLLNATRFAIKEDIPNDLILVPCKSK